MRWGNLWSRMLENVWGLAQNCNSIFTKILTLTSVSIDKFLITSFGLTNLVYLTIMLTCCFLPINEDTIQYHCCFIEMKWDQHVHKKTLDWWRGFGVLLVYEPQTVFGEEQSIGYTWKFQIRVGVHRRGGGIEHSSRTSADSHCRLQSLNPTVFIPLLCS